MAESPELVRVGVRGRINVAPLGTVAPLNATTAWGTGWVDLGVLGEDGLVIANEEDREEFTPWGWSSPIRSQITSATTTFQFAAWETSAVVLSLVDRVSVADMEELTNGEDPEGVAYDAKRPSGPDYRMFGFDVIDGNSLIRYVVPRGEVTERDDITFASGEVGGYSLTVTAFENSEGVRFRRYQNDLVIPA